MSDERTTDALEAEGHAGCPHHPGGMCEALRHPCDNDCHHAPYSPLSRCRHRIHDSITALAEKCRRLEQEVAIDDKLLAERNHLLDLFTCSMHGSGCVPHALDEVVSMRQRIATLERELAEAREKWGHVESCRCHRIGLGRCGGDCGHIPTGGKATNVPFRDPRCAEVKR